MGKSDEYRAALHAQKNWDQYLRRESGLPGPRGNLELARAVMLDGERALFQRYILLGPDKAPENTPDVFLAFCGVVGLGRLITEGEAEHFQTLRRFASDPRWRIREAVAMALQHAGDADMSALLREMKRWSRGNDYEQRAAAAALCEPRLLKEEEVARDVLDLLHAITTQIGKQSDRKSDAFLTLQKGMGYCWSVAVVHAPEYGKRLMEQWIVSDDKDIRWIIKENLKKNRLVRCDAKWVKRMLQKHA